MMHDAQNDLPLGGVGPSGVGTCHGIEGFRGLSRAKGILEQAAGTPPISCVRRSGGWQMRFCPCCFVSGMSACLVASQAGTPSARLAWISSPTPSGSDTNVVILDYDYDSIGRRAILRGSLHPPRGPNSARAAQLNWGASFPRGSRWRKTLGIRVTNADSNSPSAKPAYSRLERPTSSASNRASCGADFSALRKFRISFSPMISGER
jgi:hypothetical protein